MKKILIFFFLFLGVVINEVSAQLSEGGIPRKITGLKSGSVSIIRMPFVNNDILRWTDQRENSGLLKPLTFAHPFEVNISPVTAGSWNHSNDGWYIWQTQIISEGAFSLNLIFGNLQPTTSG